METTLFSIKDDIAIAKITKLEYVHCSKPQLELLKTSDALLADVKSIQHMGEDIRIAYDLKNLQSIELIRTKPLSEKLLFLINLSKVDTFKHARICLIYRLDNVYLDVSLNPVFIHRLLKIFDYNQTAFIDFYKSVIYDILDFHAFFDKKILKFNVDLKQLEACSTTKQIRAYLVNLYLIEKNRINEKSRRKKRIRKLVMVLLLGLIINSVACLILLGQR